MAERGGTGRLRRLALRGLVVAGFAGAAWLLSASAAHASTGHGTGPAADTTQVTAGLTGLLAPLTQLVSHTVAPVTDVLDRVTAPVTGTAVELVGGRHVHAAPVAKVDAAPVGTPIATPAAAAVHSAQRTHATTGSRSAPVGYRAGPAGANLPVAPQPAPFPAPLPAFPGSGATGMPTSLAGSHPDAVVTSPIAGTAMAGHRPEGQTDVPLRRLSAKGPTVSPD